MVGLKRGTIQYRRHTLSRLRPSHSLHAVTSLVILIVAALPRVWAAWHDHGIFWPDEIYQSLEPAHRLVFGYGLVPWEFRDGARSWLFPGMFAVVWKAAALVGLRTSPILVRLAKLIMVLLALGGIVASMRLARQRAGQTAAIVCGVLAASFPPSLVYAARAMSEMASGPLVVIAALLLWSDDRKKQWIAGALAATAIFLRYQNGIVWLGILAALFADSAERRDRPRMVAMRFVVAGAAVALVAGVGLEL
ncbi:MAG: Alg9 family protein mannosyltransferase, partial [bacterium]|nr:Alg9 family protein mannosyltransferase [bacterium]